jgi:chromosomal replication initiator protein
MTTEQGMTNQELWQAILGNLEVILSKPNFTTWFRQTSIVNRGEDVLVIGVPNAFTKMWLQNKYHQEILKAVKRLSPEIKEIRYQIATQTTSAPQITNIPGRTSSSEERRHENRQERRANGDISLNGRYTFGSFVVGSSNQLAHAAATAVAKKPGLVYNPFFIYGGVGLGKTHLMQAIGHEVKKLHPSKHITYVTTERFTNEFVQSVERGTTEAFKERYRKTEILLIDDIQFLAGKERTQEEFFHTFNTLYQNNHQIILSSDRLPKEIPAIEARLVSRFQGGMIADIQPPDYETRLAILGAKVREQGYDVDQDVLSYIAQLVDSNIRELEGTLNRLMVYCQIHGTRPVLSEVKPILESVIVAPRKRSIAPKEIIDLVANFYHVTPDDLVNQSRRKEYVKPRQIAMYLIRKELDASLPSIGELFGGRDHTTVIHAVGKVSRELKDKEGLKQEVENILEKLYE